MSDSANGVVVPPLAVFTNPPLIGVNEDKTQTVYAMGGPVDEDGDLRGRRVPIPAPTAYSWGQAGIKFTQVGQTHTKLPPGVYIGMASNTGVYLSKMENKTDELLQFVDGASVGVLKELEEFQNRRSLFRQYGFLHKRGILLYGPPGSGKTSTIQLIINKIVNDAQGVALFVTHPGIATEALRQIRSAEPDRQIVAVMEDFDGLVKEHGAAGFLSLLDGEAQIDNVVMLATTNYPDLLEKRFIDRPSRFDLVVEVDFPSVAARRHFFTAKFAGLIPPATVEWFVEQTDGFSVAHLREVVILHNVFGLSREDTLTRLHAFNVKRKTKDRKLPNTEFGFAKL